MKIINKIIHSWINVTLVADKIYIYTTKYIKKTKVLLINVIESSKERVLIKAIFIQN